ncbi:MAG TPA: PA14 domain-containing protein, partial [Acidimicrobiia bacterium]|nr:PA14 domain-containing protein [Acidimicrobiia bacterium]
MRAAGAQLSFTGEGDTAAVTLGVDAAWLDGLAATDFPVVIDPWVWDSGSADDHAYSSDGYVCDPCATMVGNDQGGAGGADAYWRGLSHFGYGGIFGRQVLDVNLHLWELMAGTLVPYHVQVNEASAFSYDGMGAWLARTESVIDDAWFSTPELVGFYQWLADVEWGDAYLMFSGHQAPGVFTFKQFRQRWLYIDVNGWPGVSLSSPASGSSLHTTTPTLSASGSDPDGDALSYNVQVCTDPGMSACWASGWQGSPSWTPSVSWNQTYWWRTFACDAFACAVSSIANFATANATPPAPTPTAPSADGVVTLTDQTLSASGSDPDGDAVSYQFQVGTGADPAAGRMAVSPWTGPSWTPPKGTFGDGGPHSFRVRAMDSYGFVSGWSAPRSFRADWRLGRRATLPYDEVGAAAVNLASGNLVIGVGGPQYATLGGPVGAGFSYNAQAPIVHGLSADYWDDPNANGVLDAGEPRVLHQTDPTLAFNWGGTGPSDGPNAAIMDNQSWLARWSGSIRVPPGQAGAWTFVSEGTDDTVKVTVNGVAVLTTTACCTRVEGTPTVLNDISPSAIQVDYTQGAGAARLHLKLKSPQGVEYEIPSDWLLPETPALPHGWSRAGDSFTGAAYTALRPVSAAATLVVDASGADHEFKASGTGWQPPPGEDALLTQRADGTWSLLGGDGYLYRFGADGRLLDVTSSADDAHPGAPTYTYGAVLPGFPTRLQRVTDASGRSIDFTYGGSDACPTAAGLDAHAPAGMLCRIAYTGFGGGVTDLLYSNGQLARIVNPGDEVTDFGYDASGRLTQARDPLTNDLIASGAFNDAAADTHKTLIGYDGASRVSTITAPVAIAAMPEAQRPRRTYSYAGTQTTVAVAGLLTNGGPARTVTLDAYGHATSELDAAGITTTNVWDTANDRIVKVTRAGLVTTYFYDAAGRLTETYGPGAPGEFGADNRSATAPHATSA